MNKDILVLLFVLTFAVLIGRMSTYKGLGRLPLRLCIPAQDYFAFAPAFEIYRLGSFLQASSPNSSCQSSPIMPDRDHNFLANARPFLSDIHDYCD